jgi:hypothetical protein
MYDIVIAQEPWDRMWAYVDECPDEVACFGYVKADEEIGAFYVYELFLVPQEVSGAEVDFVSDGLPYAVERAVKDGKIEDLRVCIHSHVNMPTSFSSKDEDMIRKVATGGTPWFISAVFNKKGETNGRVDLFDSVLPFGFGPEQLTLKANVMTEHSRAIIDESKAELAQFVKKQVVTPGPTGGATGKGWRQPMKQTAGASPSGAPNVQPRLLGSGESTNMNWWEDGLEDELELWITARRESWEIIEDSDGKIHFFDTDGEYQGSVDDYMDEGTIDWFISRGWADDLDMPELTDDSKPNRENTP